MLEKRARNLYVIAGAIIVYLFAGTDLDQLTVLGIRAPARFPVVFSLASVVALLWFWWRYHVTWQGGGTRTSFRNGYFAELHQKDVFKAYVKDNIDRSPIIHSYMGRTRHRVPTNAPFVRFHENRPTVSKRLLIYVNQLTVNEGTTNHQMEVRDFPDGKPILLRVPRWLHCIHSPGFFLRRAFRDEIFVNQLLPQLVFAVAIFLIVCKWSGLLVLDPAGVWGLLDSPISENPWRH